MSTAKTVYLSHTFLNEMYYLSTLIPAVLFIASFFSTESVIPMIMKLIPIITAKVIKNFKNVELNMTIIIAPVSAY